MTDGNQINSVSGVLKSFFRELTEPLFTETYFDQFMNITSNVKYPEIKPNSRYFHSGNSAPPHVTSVKDKIAKSKDTLIL